MQPTLESGPNGMSDNSDWWLHKMECHASSQPTQPVQVSLQIPGQRIL